MPAMYEEYLKTVHKDAGTPSKSSGGTVNKRASSPPNTSPSNSSGSLVIKPKIKTNDKKEGGGGSEEKKEKEEKVPVPKVKIAQKDESDDSSETDSTEKGPMMIVGRGAQKQPGAVTTVSVNLSGDAVIRKKVSKENVSEEKPKKEEKKLKDSKSAKNSPKNSREPSPRTTQVPNSKSASSLPEVSLGPSTQNKSSPDLPRTTLVPTLNLNPLPKNAEKEKISKSHDAKDRRKSDNPRKKTTSANKRNSSSSKNDHKRNMSHSGTSAPQKKLKVETSESAEVITSIAQEYVEDDEDVMVVELKKQSSSQSTTQEQVQQNSNSAQPEQPTTPVVSAEKPFVKPPLVRFDTRPDFSDADLAKIFKKETPKDNYTKGKYLGSGAYGNVYVGKSTHKNDKTKIAIKIFELKKKDKEKDKEKEKEKGKEKKGKGEDQVPLKDDDDDRGRSAVEGVEDIKKRINMIALEVSMMKLCKCDHVVAVLDAYLGVDQIWVVLEYCDAGSLRDLSAMPVKEEILRYAAKSLYLPFLKMLLGLNHMHSMGVVHRDVKGENVLLNLDGQVKIADLGLAVRVGPTDKLSSLCGSRYWMAPEIILKKGYHTKVDIWSFAATLIEIITGDPPYGKHSSMAALFYTATKGYTEYTSLGNPPSSTSTFSFFSSTTTITISDSFVKFLGKCFVLNPDQRSTAKELLEDPWITQKEPSKEKFQQAVKMVFIMKYAEQDL